MRSNRTYSRQAPRSNRLAGWRLYRQSLSLKPAEDRSTWTVFFQGENTGITAWNPLTWLASAALIAFIAVTLSHKIFSLITWVPDNVMRWIGHGSQQLGEHQAEGETRNAFVGFASGKRGVAEHLMTGGGKDGTSPKGPKGPGEGGETPAKAGANPAGFGEKPAPTKE
ncbi:MAG: hypothetical protein ACYDHY_18275 [Acidiferrobacterales bacterium]